MIRLPRRATKEEMVRAIIERTHLRSKIEGSLSSLYRLPVEEVTLLAIAFCGYRDPEARADAERRAGWEREQREREAAQRAKDDAARRRRRKALPAPPLKLPAPDEPT